MWCEVLTAAGVFDREVIRVLTALRWSRSVTTRPPAQQEAECSSPTELRTSEDDESEVKLQVDPDLQYLSQQNRWNVKTNQSVKQQNKKLL